MSESSPPPLGFALVTEGSAHMRDFRWCAVTKEWVPVSEFDEFLPVEYFLSLARPECGEEIEQHPVSPNL